MTWQWLQSSHEDQLVSNVNAVLLLINNLLWHCESGSPPGVPVQHIQVEVWQTCIVIERLSWGCCTWQDALIAVQFARWMC